MLGDERPVHPVRMLDGPAGGRIPIDLDLVPLMRDLWARGIRTKSSCQNYGEWLEAEYAVEKRWAAFYRGYVWLKLPSDHAASLIARLSEDAELRAAMREWARPDSWICVRPITPMAFGGSLLNADEAHLFFPRAHLPLVIQA